MQLNFRQGIVSYPSSGLLQTFLSPSGNNVDLEVAGSHADIAFAHGAVNYLLTETTNVLNAWVSIPASTNVWLYWDLDTLTALRTFGFTQLAPSFGTTFPAHAADQHFFNTTDNKMYVSDGVAWHNVIRVFAAKYNTSGPVFTPLGSGFPLQPYAGTQVGLTGALLSIPTGTILFDETAAPVIRDLDGTFFTTEDAFFTQGATINALRLESVVMHATANTNLAAYQVVRYSDFGIITPATYFDLQDSAIAMVTEDLLTNDTGAVVFQGVITNPAWNWTVVGAALWIDSAGRLVDVDPHLSAPLTFPNGKAPIARVLTPTSIIFDQAIAGNITLQGGSTPPPPIVIPIEQIVYGTGASVTSDPSFTWDSTTKTLKIGSIAAPGTITGANGSSSAGAALTVEAGNGNGAGFAGGALTLRSGSATDGNAGNVSLIGADPVGTNRNGGTVNIQAGGATGTGTPGSINLTTASGAVVQQNGNFFSNGDAQTKMYVLRTSTSNGVLTEMFLDGAGGVRRMVIPIDTAWHFECSIVGRRTDVDNDSAGYRMVGVIHNNGGTVSIVGGVTQSIDAEVSPAWDVAVDADNVNKALRVQVLGEAGKSVRWVAFVRTVEVTG